MELKKLGRGFACHLVDATALNTAINPAFAFLETVVCGMSQEVSLNARVFASLSGYLGVGSILSKGRDLSRHIFGVTDKTKESVQQLHDAAYLVAFNAAYAPIIYTVSGCTDLKEIAAGTLTSMALGAVAGGPVGYTIDLFRDLTGLKKSERIPKILEKKKPRVKKGLAALLVAASIVIVGGVYTLIPEENNMPERPAAVILQTQNKSE